MFINSNEKWMVGDVSNEDRMLASGAPPATAVVLPAVVFLSAMMWLADVRYGPMPFGAYVPGIIVMAIAMIFSVMFDLDFARSTKGHSIEGRKIHRITRGDPLDRLLYECGGDHSFLDRHNNTVDALFETIGVWDAWETLCNTPSLSKEEKGRLNELINRYVQDTAHTMREFDAEHQTINGRVSYELELAPKGELDN